MAGVKLEIQVAYSGVLVSGRYGHGKPRKPVNPPLSALHGFENSHYFRDSVQKNDKKRMKY